MAIYHTRVKTFSRAQGHASTAAAAYRAGLLIVDARTGLKHDYRRRGGVVETRCIAPDDAPDWAFDPRALWPAAEASEKRKDATVAREFEVALPHEMSDDERSALTADIARALVQRYRFAVQASIHAPQTPDGLNYHAHLLATTRRLDGEGLADKTRELDGGPSGRGEVEWIREMVAQPTNAHLAAARHVARVDHRSLKAQAEAAIEQGDDVAALALTRQPTEHMGKDATAVHRRGMDSQRVQANAQIAAHNEKLWSDALEALQAQGRLQPASPGHTHAQAVRERQALAAPVLSPVRGDGQIRVIRGLGRPASTTAKGDPRDLTRTALAEAIGLWREGFIATIDMSFKATTQLLRHSADRVAAFVEKVSFRADVAELVTLIKRVRRDALRFKRRMAGEQRAMHLLHQAEFAMEHFDSDHPRPGVWSRQEWTKRRARRLRALKDRQDAYSKAREATGPDAQRDYEQRTMASANELEAWSARMLKRYPVPADEAATTSAEAAPAEPAPQAQAEADAKPTATSPRVK
jgi:hypothetical protein